MRDACLTIDLDRDVNFLHEGRALSRDIGSGTSPRFDSSVKGLAILAELLDDLNIRATFFIEAVALGNVDVSMLDGHEIALHGLEHEDIGEMARTSTDETENVLTEAMNSIEDITDRRPTGFRAPFMRTDPKLYPILESIGIRYDSSEYMEMNERMHPYMIGGIREVPVPRGYDRSGKRIAAYLWQMHEGNRDPDDYVDLASSMTEGTFVIATHTWHMAETVGNGIMSIREMRRNASDTADVITGLMDSGISFRTMDSVL